MALSLEIEYLGGVCYAASSDDVTLQDWPPQPDRVFSALVATWAAHGQPEDERQALEWLESLPTPPQVCASATRMRSVPAAFVPPNDYATPSGDLARLKWYRDYLGQGLVPPKPGNYRKDWKRAWAVLPDERRRSGLKERRFPASRPQDPVVRHYWSEEPDDALLDALERLARDTSYVGHSSSLTRCRFSRTALAPTARLIWPGRRIYPGRLRELCDAHARFERSADRKARPALGAPVVAPPALPQPRANLFAERWLLLEHVGGTMPDLRAAAVVARGIRIALMSGYGRLDLTIPSEVSGHQNDGSPARGPHLAVVPLPFAGFTHADGRVLGFALVPPAGSGLLDDPQFLSVLRHLTRLDGRYPRRLMEVRSPVGTPAAQAFALQLAPTFEPSASRRSLDSRPYTGSASIFATVTPIVLDRHPKSRGDALQDEVAGLVALACRRVGLPEPEAVQASRQSAPMGVPPAYPSRPEPDWMRWQLPRSLVSRQLSHAVIRFGSPVQGPVLLGAGRFVGLGLCLPYGGEGSDAAS